MAMKPDFSKNTIRTVASRAAYLCSNPDCRKITVGPNSNPEKSTLVGEAAHIFGARRNSKRYKSSMTDATRSEITNAIWLCRNCHKLIDSDELRYSGELLFKWRELHERYVFSELSNETDKLLAEKNYSQLLEFETYPSIIKRIIIDRPVGWEWRLSSELMRYMNQPSFQKMRDLRDGLYTKPQQKVNDDEVIEWIQDRLSDYQQVVGPLSGLMNRLTTSWGAPGEEGDVKEIHHTIILINEFLQQIIIHEESIHFVRVSENYQNLVNMLKNLLSSQAEKLKTIPSFIDEAVELISEIDDLGIKPKDEVRIVKKSINFDAPENWTKNFNKELKRIQKSSYKKEQENGGCLLVILVISTPIFLWFLF